MKRQAVPIRWRWRKVGGEMGKGETASARRRCAATVHFCIGVVRAANSGKMKTVLVTGFEPFAGAVRNPSQEIARALDGREIAGCRVIGVTLPCVFGESRRLLVRLLRTHRPRLV